MAGRIESYMHSDMSVPNKGGALVEVNCKTDFAARTNQFVTFAKEVAKMAFASGADTWDNLIGAFPDLEDHRKEVADVIGERITVNRIVVMTV
jgi:elongation factor Ts